MKRHCDLCDHQVLNLKEGSICGVTNRKPDFNRTCVKIELNNNLLNSLEDVLVNYEDLKLTKNKVFKNFVIGSIIGVFLLICGYLVFDYFLNNGYRVYLKSTKCLITFPSIILVSGYYFVKKSIDNLNRHKHQLINIENSKKEIEEVLSLYNKKYKYKIDFDKEVHGTQEIDIEIQFI
ncbi:MAG: hypothetical protein V3V28_12470 [Polaribacter sp.]|uniref:hypothetical protein n=1 Tax=Polaribacter sp. TaxID=1920175 RepID=UPI002F3599E4